MNDRFVAPPGVGGGRAMHRENVVVFISRSMRPPLNHSLASVVLWSSPNGCVPSHPAGKQKHNIYIYIMHSATPSIVVPCVFQNKVWFAANQPTNQHPLCCFFALQLVSTVWRATRCRLFPVPAFPSRARAPWVSLFGKHVQLYYNTINSTPPMRTTAFHALF